MTELKDITNHRLILIEVEGNNNNNMRQMGMWDQVTIILIIKVKEGETLSFLIS